MTRRNVRRATGTRILLAAVLMTLVTGCENSVEPTTFTTIDDAKAYASTRSDVQAVFDTAATSAIEAVGGGEIRNGDKVRDMTCGEAYGKEFRELEIGGSFVTRGAGFDAVIAGVQDAWGKQGWVVELTDPDRMSLETETSAGVRVTGWATVQEAASDPRSVAVSLKVGTGCLKLPQSVVDDL